MRTMIHRMQCCRMQELRFLENYSDHYQITMKVDSISIIYVQRRILKNSDCSDQ